MSLLKYESQLREPLVDGDKDYHQVTEDICSPIETKPTATVTVPRAMSFFAFMGMGREMLVTHQPVWHGVR